ncbi:MAG TPA: hypothetical protein VM733_09515 [Thermoanaerobaculia bacterium]|nr:hypothetical protein [Thermoanaerobaculia bacterium]
MRIALTVCLLAAAPLLAHPPVSVVMDSHGNLFYSDLEQVWRVAPDGVSKTVAVPNVHTHELYMDAQDNLFGEHLWYNGDATKTWGHYVWKRDAAGRVTRVKPASDGFLTNYSFIRDRAGNMFWADRDHGRIVRIAPNGAITHVASELKAMRWLHVTRRGTLYVVDGTDLVRIRNGRTERFVRNITSAERHTMMGLWSDAAENLYIADSEHHRVKRVTPDGTVKSFVRSPLPWSPIGGLFAPNGDLWLMEATITNQVRLRRVERR